MAEADGVDEDVGVAGWVAVGVAGLGGVGVAVPVGVAVGLAVGVGVGVTRSPFWELSSAGSTRTAVPCEAMSLMCWIAVSVKPIVLSQWSQPPAGILWSEIPSS